MDINMSKSLRINGESKDWMNALAAPERNDKRKSARIVLVKNQSFLSKEKDWKHPILKFCFVFSFDKEQSTSEV